MRPALVLLLPAALVAQPPRHGSSAAPDLRRVRLGTDTLELQLAADSSLRFRMVESLTRTPGPAGGRVRQVVTVRGPGDDDLITVDTVVAAASSLALERSVTIRVSGDGRELYRATDVVRNGELISDEPADSGRRVTRTPVPPTSSVLALPNLVMRTAPLSSAWRPTLTFRIPSAGHLLTLTVDSVGRGSEAGRRVWLIHADPGDRSRLRYAIDSLTRDLVAFTVRDTAGHLVSTMRNLRYFTAPPLKTTAATPADVQRVAGHYYLEGEREVGSELLLRPDGTFEFMLTYGALDQLARGRWRMRGTDVVLKNTGTKGERDLLWFDDTVARADDGVLRIPVNGKSLRYVRH